MSGVHEPVEVVTFGCRLNIVESEAIRREATAAGHQNLVVINTCAVTAEASRQARQAIRRTRRERPDARILVTGCASELEAESFSAMGEVDGFVPNASKAAPATWSRQGRAGAPPPPPPPPRQSAHTRGFVEIQNGCDHRCTFCIIPFGRGRSRSTPPGEVVATIRRLLQTGVREVVLTGVDITSYAADGLRLGGLVRALLRAVPDLERLRLSSIDCIEADADLLEVIANERRFMPHLHLSLQSGADLILKRMKRRHSRAEAIGFCADIRRLRPDMVFGADAIVGFPTETEAHFLDTLDMIEACGITHLHVFPYSPRPGTPATRMPAVAGDVVKARAARLRQVGQHALRCHLDRNVGRQSRILTEAGGRGRAEDFTPMRIGDMAPNLMLDVLVTGHDGRELQGTLACP